MTEEPHAPGVAEPAFPDEPAAAPPAGEPASEGPRPELIVGGAFAGGFLAAMILKRFGD